MTTIRKMLIHLSLVLSILSCSKSEFITSKDNLDFIVLSINEYYYTPDYSTFNQLSVLESGEIIETDLVSEFGGIEPINTFQPRYQIEGDLLLYRDPDQLHIKNLRTNLSKSINTLCDVSLDNSNYNVITTESKILVDIRSVDGKTKDFLTIDKSLKESSCKRRSYNKSPFHSSSSFQYSNAEYVLFDKKNYKDEWNYETFLYAYNAKSDQLDSISSEELAELKYADIVMGKDKFYVFLNRTYKSFNFEFNLLEEGTCDQYFSPISGGHIVENRMKVIVYHTTETGFYSTVNVYDLKQRKFLIDETLPVEEPIISPDAGRIVIAEYDLKRERIIYAFFYQESGYKILITDFNNNVLREIPINSRPFKISIL